MCQHTHVLEPRCNGARQRRFHSIKDECLDRNSGGGDSFSQLNQVGRSQHLQSPPKGDLQYGKASDHSHHQVGWSSEVSVSQSPSSQLERDVDRETIGLPPGDGNQQILQGSDSGSFQGNTMVQDITTNVQQKQQESNSSPGGDENLRGNNGVLHDASSDFQGNTLVQNNTTNIQQQQQGNNTNGPCSMQDVPDVML